MLNSVLVDELHITKFGMEKIDIGNPYLRTFKIKSWSCDQTFILLFDKIDSKTLEINLYENHKKNSFEYLNLYNTY